VIYRSKILNLTSDKTGLFIVSVKKLKKLKKLKKKLKRA